jgi:hypothetical protein
LTVSDLHAGREATWVPLHAQHANEVVSHRLAFPGGEVAGHQVNDHVLLPDPCTLAIYGLLVS